MTENQQVVDAEATQNISDGNMDYGDFLSHRIKVPEQPEPDEVQEEEPEPEEAEADPPEETVDREGETETEDEATAVDAETVLSQLEKLTPEEIKAISKEIGSRAGERIGTLTARRKQAEAEAAELRNKLKQYESDPLASNEPIENNPFSDIDSIDDLRAQARNLEEVDEWADRLLWKHSNADPEDVITTEDGKELTKEQVREYQLNARKSLKKFLPARVADIQRREMAKVEEAQVKAQVQEQLPWIADKETELYKAYDATIKNPVIAKIKEKVPEVAPRLDAIIAHAINSMSNSAPKKQAEKKREPSKPVQARPKPPSNPSGSLGSTMERPEQSMSRKLKELSSRVEESGQFADYQRLRAEQIANRRK